MIISLLGWLTVLVQLYLMLHNKKASVPETLFRFFGFFTILTNILVAVCCTVLASKPGARGQAFFSRSSTQAAIAMYISVVGLVYNLVLRQLWAPQGMQRVVDELLHLILPLLFVLYWLVLAPKQGLKWNGFWPWLIYPLAYVIYSLGRGALSGFYPYPFIDVSQLGMPRVLLNSLGLTLVFFLFSLLFIGLGRLMSKNR